MKLPPPGSDPVQIATFVNSLVEEASQDTYRMEWVADANRALDLYLGDHWTTANKDDEIRLVLNRIQNCVIAIVAIQAGDPPKFTFTPRESGEPPIVYLNTQLPQAAAAASQLSELGIDPEEPLPDEIVAWFRRMVTMSEAATAQAAAMGLPPPDWALPKEVLVEVTDFTSAATLQTVFDGTIEACDFQPVFIENVFNKNIIGIQPTLYEFDDDERRHLLTNPHAKQVFFDPLKSSNGHYTIYDEPISEDEAKALYPEIADAIEEHAQTNNLQFPGGNTYDAGDRFTRSFRRRMIAIRHAWFRFQPYTMSTEDALGSGKVKLVGVPTGQTVRRLDPDTQQVVDEPETRDAYVHADTGEELTEPVRDAGSILKPTHKKWPVRYLIRQLKIVADRVVEDRPCQCPDVPIVNNVNLPIPYSPYGQGEPKRLEGLQMALNRVLSSIVTHQAYNAVPPELVPQQVVEKLDKALQGCRTKPNQRLIIPPDLVDLVQGDLKKLLQIADVPSVPADFWKLLDFLVQMIDSEGNQAQVMQGNASAGWSGETVAALQNAASQVIRGKSIHTEAYLKRLARLMVYSIVHRMTEDDWRRYCSKYPPQALRAMYQRAKSLDIDISVQITSGSGAAKQAQTQNLIAARAQKVPVSDDTILERLDLDPDAERQKAMAAQQKVQAMQAIAGQIPASVPAPPAAAGSAPNNPTEQAVA